MNETFLVTTSTAGLRPLGSVGQRSYELITQTLRSAGMVEEARLFAEPEQTTHGESSDWYTSFSGKIVPLRDADEETRTEAQLRLTSLMGNIARTAEQLRAEKSAERQRLGEALANALIYPGDESVLLVLPKGDDARPEPVIVNWGWSYEDQPIAHHVPLAVEMPAAPPPKPAVAPAPPPLPDPPPAAPAPEPRPPWRWNWLVALAWGIVGLLALWVLWLLIPACGVRLGPWADFCPAPLVAQADPMDDLSRERAQLENRIRRAEATLEDRDAACLPAPPPPAPEPEPEPEPAPTPPPPQQDSELQRRLERDQANEGELEIALAWNNTSDLDLHLTCPGGQRINFSNKVSQACGGALDVDANVSSTRRDPVEHIYFTDPPSGTYQVTVRLFKTRHSSAPHPFTLQLKLGSDIRTLRGTVSNSRKVWSTSFTYP